MNQTSLKTKWFYYKETCFDRLIHGFVDTEDMLQHLVDIVSQDTLNLEKMEMPLLLFCGTKDKSFESIDSVSITNKKA